MGNLQSVLVGSTAPESMQTQEYIDGRILDTIPFEDWASGAEQYCFPPPCLDGHSEQAGQFNYKKCFTQEIRGSRRRTIQFRHILGKFTAELEQGRTGHHNLHIRNLAAGSAHVIALHNVNGSLRELDFMIDPVLTVLAYWKDVLVIGVQEKTKNIPKITLVCDIGTEEHLGCYAVQVNYNNLNGLQIECAISPNGTNIIMCIVEDHYDEFVMHFHAFVINGNGSHALDSLGDLNCPHTTWYAPTIHMCFLPEHNNLVAVLGDIPFTSSTDSSRFLLIYDIFSKSAVRAVELTDNLYPISLCCSQDGSWITTLSRNVSERNGELETYVTRMYFSETLVQHMEVQNPLSCDAFNFTSNCNKVTLSNPGHLVAIASTSEMTSVVEFDPWGPNLFYHGTSSVKMTVYRLPVVKPSLKQLSRDTVLNACCFPNLTELPLPKSLLDFVRYQT